MMRAALAASHQNSKFTRICRISIIVIVRLPEMMKEEGVGLGWRKRNIDGDEEERRCSVKRRGDWLKGKE